MFWHPQNSTAAEVMLLADPKEQSKVCWLFTNKIANSVLNHALSL